MPGGSAQLRGADQLADSLDAAAARLADLSDAEREAGQLLAERGAQAAPRRTGRLAAAHGYTVTDAGLSVTAATPYAAIVHARNPWLLRTVDAQSDRVAQLYLADVVDVLADVKGT